MGIRGKWGIINLPIIMFTFVLQQYEPSLVPRSISPPVFNTFDVAVPSVSMCQISLGPFHIILSHKWNKRFSLNCVFFTTTLNPLTKYSTSYKAHHDTNTWCNFQHWSLHSLVTYMPFSLHLLTHIMIGIQTVLASYQKRACMFR